MSTRDSELPEWTDEERALLGSALDDTPPSGSLKASLKAVAGLGAAGSAATLSKAAAAVAHAKPAAALGLVKWAGIVVVGGAVATAAGVAVRRASVPAPVPAAAPAVIHSDSVAVPPAMVAEPMPQPNAEEPGLPTPSPVADDRKPAPGKAEAPSQPDIAEEIRSFDAARAALREGRPAEALSALDRYAERYGRKGSFAVEATVLRIEALAKNGDRARAQALANSFLAAHPKSPYAARIRARLGMGGL